MARTITLRPEVGACARIIQHSALNLPQLRLDQAALIVVQRGVKTMRSAHGEFCIQAGQAVALAAGQQCDIHNQPDSHGCYEAAWIALDDSLLRPFQPSAGSAPIRSALLMRELTGIFPAFDLAVDAICNPQAVPLTIARHRLTELLLWLDLAGGYFPVSRTSSTAARVRQLLAHAPAQTWTAPVLAQRLAMSEATLRRRLVAESTSWSALLVDVRMTFALTLLQSTDQAVAEIALQSGYESASRFALRFRQRFGFHPSAIRGHQHLIKSTENLIYNGNAQTLGAKIY